MLCKKLEDLRIAKSVSKKEVARFLGVHESTYGKYELGKRIPDIEIIGKIADYFNTTTDYLLGRTNDPMPPGAARQVAPDPFEGLSDADRQRAEAFIQALKVTAPVRKDSELADDLTPIST